MDPDAILTLLEAVRDGSATPAQAMQTLKHLPTRRLHDVAIDSHRSLRRGVGEVIFASGKSDTQIETAIRLALDAGPNCLVTRLEPPKAPGLLECFAEHAPAWHEEARLLSIVRKAPGDLGRGEILVITAGSSDVPVAEEAALTCEFFGNRVLRAYDVGVAGIHRLLEHWESIARATVIIAVAGMEGALPSVVAGLAPCPVIAVPTRVGYGASFGGLAALLAMLNSCAGGVSVVNIDNGFGAAMSATLINRRREHP